MKQSYVPYFRQFFFIGIQHKLLYDGRAHLLIDFVLHWTVLILAHRLSTIRGANEIIIMQKGEVKEREPFYRLMWQNSCWMPFTHLINNKHFYKEA